MMLNRHNFGWALVVLLTFGCSTTPVKWYKPGISQGTFLHDKAECEGALLATGSTGLPRQIYTFEGCMEKKGYTVVPAS